MHEPERPNLDHLNQLTEMICVRYAQQCEKFTRIREKLQTIGQVVNELYWLNWSERGVAHSQIAKMKAILNENGNGQLVSE